MSQPAGPRRSGAREWLQRAAVVAATLLLFAAAGEIACRALYGDELNYTGWGPAYQRWFGSLHVDPLGLRCGEEGCPAPEPDPDAWTILVLGDSVVFGSGVSYDSIFTSVLEDLLNARGGGRRYRVVNVSGPGLDTAGELAALNRVAPHVNPDVILLIYFPNDAIEENDPRLSRFTGHLLGERLGGFLHRRSAFYYFLESRIYRLAERWGGKQGYEEFVQQSYDEGNPHLEAHLEAVQQVVATSRLNSKPVGIVLFPMLYRLDDYPFQRAHDLVATIARVLEVPLLDLLPAFRGLDAGDLVLSAYDNHPNEAGHALAAKPIADWLEAAKLLPAPGKAADGSAPGPQDGRLP